MEHNDQLRLMRLLILGLYLVSVGWGQRRSYVYVGDVGVDRVLLAWGTTEGNGKNTIGRESEPLGSVTVSLDGRRIVSDKNWVEVAGLQEDHVYEYQVRLGTQTLGSGRVRTWPRRAKTLCFFVIGDYGSGDSHQSRVARLMQEEFEKRTATPCPIRFVLTTGDNIYSSSKLPWHRIETGDDDHDWDRKFFEPYKEIIASIPFYPSLGNHDGRESEKSGDLLAYLDNFFFPLNRPARQYQLGYAGLADFFVLDTTRNTDDALEARAAWLRDSLANSKASWRIAVGHHPPLSAGPRHSPDLEGLGPMVAAWREYNVAVYFCGHEHNFHVSADPSPLGRTRMVLTGAGGELRPGDVRRRMKAASIAAWAPVNHFLAIELDDSAMKIFPLSPAAAGPVDAEGRGVQIPLAIKRPK